MESGSPAAALVDHFPISRCKPSAYPQLTIEATYEVPYIPSWIPCSALKSEIWALGPSVGRLTDELFSRAKASMVSPTWSYTHFRAVDSFGCLQVDNKSDSFIASVLQQRASSLSSSMGDQEEEEIKSVAFTVYIGM